jgi:hypothetical protein
VPPTIMPLSGRTGRTQGLITSAYHRKSVHPVKLGRKNNA